MEEDGVWTWTRVGFYSMLALYVVVFFLPESFFETTTGGLLILAMGVSIFGTFILSVIHLVKYPEKGLAVTALVLSSIFGLFYMIGVFAGMMEVI